MMAEDDKRSPQEKQRDKTLKLIEKDQIENSLGKSDLDEELEDATEDTAKEETFVEEKVEGEDVHISPISDAGAPETTREAIDERFSKEYDSETELLRKNKQRNAKSGIDKPSDETPQE
jgi:hypothetical protein